MLGLILQFKQLTLTWYYYICLMKLTIALLLIFIHLNTFAQLTDSINILEIEQFRKELNKDYKDPSHSPLTKKDRRKFKGHYFYSINLEYRIIANIVLTPESDTFGMKTTTDRKPLYRKYGIAYFNIKGKPLQLSIYQNIEFSQIEAHSNSLFLLFNDQTNGDESYGGGRYIDLTKTNNSEIIIDFNMSYNPYCHYNSKYSCPIPPPENSLPIAIEAGIKLFPSVTHH